MAIDDEQFDMKALVRTGRLLKTEPTVGLTRENADFIISSFF